MENPVSLSCQVHPESSSDDVIADLALLCVRRCTGGRHHAELYFFSTFENPAFLCIFALKIVIFLLLPCKTQKH